VRRLMRRDLGPHLAVPVGPKPGEAFRVVFYPIAHQSAGMLAATLLPAPASNHAEVFVPLDELIERVEQARAGPRDVGRVAGDEGHVPDLGLQKSTIYRKDTGRCVGIAVPDHSTGARMGCT
jgi:hypothetical protein